MRNQKSVLSENLPETLNDSDLQDYLKIAELGHLIRSLNKVTQYST